MACQALGRCRICAKKHKIAVFGGEADQHFFIQKANLKLIILNTVCVGCIGKIECFVKKMNLDMVFNDYIKKEEIQDTKSHARVMEGHNSVEKNDRESGKEKTTAMDVDQPVQPKENSKKTTASVAVSCKKMDAQTRPLCLGDSQTTVSHPHRSSGNEIGQGTFPGTELPNKPYRKRPRKDFETHKAGEEAQHNSLSVAVSSSSPKIAFAECGPSDCLSTGKKGGRFLWCDFCEKEFTHAGDLNKHRRKHTGEKPYECNQCQRKFAHASNLARHQRVHSGERPFSCTQCSRTFTRKDKLAIHTAAGKCQINTMREDSPRLTFSEKTKT